MKIDPERRWDSILAEKVVRDLLTVKGHIRGYGYITENRERSIEYLKGIAKGSGARTRKELLRACRKELKRERKIRILHP